MLNNEKSEGQKITITTLIVFELFWRTLLKESDKNYTFITYGKRKQFHNV